MRYTWVNSDLVGPGWVEGTELLTVTMECLCEAMAQPVSGYAARVRFYGNVGACGNNQTAIIARVRAATSVGAVVHNNIMLARRVELQSRVSCVVSANTDVYKMLRPPCCIKSVAKAVAEHRRVVDAPTGVDGSCELRTGLVKSVRPVVRVTVVGAATSTTVKRQYPLSAVTASGRPTTTTKVSTSRAGIALALARPSTTVAARFRPATLVDTVAAASHSKLGTRPHPARADFVPRVPERYVQQVPSRYEPSKPRAGYSSTAQKRFTTTSQRLFMGRPK